jgi:hypothetical protein
MPTRGCAPGDHPAVRANDTAIASTRFQRKFKIGVILLGQRRHAHWNSRQVDAFVFAQHAAIYDFANHVDAVHVVNAQFDQSIRQQNVRTLFYIFSQRLECRPHQRRGSRHIARSNRDAATRL